MTHTRKFTLWLALLGLGAFVGYWLSRPKDTAPWLTVEVPRVATAGQPLIVRVTPNAATPAMVTADLHWSTTRRESRGMLSGSRAQRIGAPGTALTFRLEVPAQDELGYVRAVVYAGPTAGWNNRVEAATSDYISVAPAAPGRGNDHTLRDIAMFEQRPDPGAIRFDSPVVQILIAGLWVAGAVGWWKSGRPDGRAPMLACAAAAVWEALPVERVVGDAARAWAISHRWYADRLGIQVFVTTLVLVAAVAAVAAVWIRQRDAAHRAVWLGLGIYAGVSLASLLSLHKVDAVLARLVLTLSTLQLIQLAAAILAVSGSGLAWRWRQAR